MEHSCQPKEQGSLVWATPYTETCKSRWKKILMIRQKLELWKINPPFSIPVKMLGCAAKPWAKTRYSQKETGVHLIVVEESSQYLDAAEKLSGTAHEEWT